MHIYASFIEYNLGKYTIFDNSTTNKTVMFVVLHFYSITCISQLSPKTGNWVAAERAIMDELCSDSSH